MTPVSLSHLLGLESEHVVCFDRDGGTTRWPAFRDRVAGVAAALRGKRGRYWAIDVRDSGEFASILCGCWAAGKTPVLAPDYLLAGSSDIGHDGVLRAGFGGISADLPDGTLPASTDLVLFTSGSTGAPTRVSRTTGNIDAELGVLDALFGPRIGDGRIYSTVSHGHVYGLLFRILWPLVTQRAFATFDFEFPENLLRAGIEPGALVSSPALLKRIGHLENPRPDGWRVVFTSGGLLPAAAARDARRLLGTCPVEVLGSTETSGVAWREQTGEDAAEFWEPLPQVRVRASREGFLESSSPFAGPEGWLRTGDKVRIATGNRFELLGRGDHIVKIEEKRVSLAEIEQHATSLPQVADAAATSLNDGSRQVVGLVVQLSDAGVADRDAAGRKAFGMMLRRELAKHLDPVAVPKRLRYVDAIPVNSQGKRLQQEIRSLFDRP